MMNKDEKLNILKTENPFTSSSVGDPWEERYPDVQSINRLAFEQITQLIDQKTKDPVLPCAGLVFGEVGSGKTHLISRILKYGRQAKFPFSFAYIQPIEDPEQTYRYFLREVMVNLCYPIDKSSNTNQLDSILEKSFNEVIEKFYPTTPVKKADQLLFEFRKDPFYLFRQKKINLRMFKDLGKMVKEVIRAKRLRSEIEKKVIRSMRIRFPDIPKEFLKVLFQYQDPEKRTAAVEWLKGVTIDEEDAALLRVADRMKDSPAMLEQKSRNILNALGTLLAYYKLPLVVCFDRLENYDTDEKIRSMGKIIEFLVDKAKAMLPVVFVRGQQWDEKIIKKLNQQVITRLKTNEFRLKGCDSDQSLEIVKTRLAWVCEADEQDPFFPFDKEELTHLFKTRLHSPRQVIILANQRLKQIQFPDRPQKNILSEGVQGSLVPEGVQSSLVPEEGVQGSLVPEEGVQGSLVPKEGVQDSPALEKLQTEFENQQHIISNDFNRYQPDRSRLKRALELYLNHALPENVAVQIESLIQPDDKYIDFECKLRYPTSDALIQAIFVIDVESNNSAVRASLNRGVDFLEKFPEGKVIYIRDSRGAIPPPPQWKATNDMLDRLRELGGNIIFLSNEQTIQWYALALLNYAVKEGDITIIDADDHTRSVSSEELPLFIKEKIHDYEVFQSIDKVLGVGL